MHLSVKLTVLLGLPNVILNAAGEQSDTDACLYKWKGDINFYMYNYIIHLFMESTQNQPIYLGYKTQNYASYSLLRWHGSQAATIVYYDMRKVHIFCKFPHYII